MELWKEEFIDYCFEKKVITVGDFTTKSGRNTWWFFNAGNFDDGKALAKLGEAYATTMVENELTDVDTIYGPAYKGIPIAVATAMALSKKGVNVGYTFDRKEEKTHGEGTGAERAKRMFVGTRPYDGIKVGIIDDVITTGGAKEEAKEKMDSVVDANYAFCLVACDRQENFEGEHASARLANKYGTKVVSIINADDVLTYLDQRDMITPELENNIRSYNDKYGWYNMEILNGE